MVDRRDACPMVEVEIASLANANSQGPLVDEIAVARFAMTGEWIPVCTGMIIREWE